MKKEKERNDGMEGGIKQCKVARLVGNAPRLLQGT